MLWALWELNYEAADLTSRTKKLSVFTFFSKWYISAPGTARTLKTPPLERADATTPSATPTSPPSETFGPGDCLLISEGPPSLGPALPEPWEHYQVIEHA